VKHTLVYHSIFSQPGKTLIDLNRCMYWGNSWKCEKQNGISLCRTHGSRHRIRPRTNSR